MVEIKTLYLSVATDDFCSKLADFLHEGFPHESKESWFARFKYWWFSNPGINENTPLGWFAINNDDSLCGFLGSVPSQFNYNNNSLQAVATTSWYVQENVRMEISPALFLSFERQKVVLFINNTPSVIVQRGLPGLGFKRTQSSPVVCNYMSIILLKKAAVHYSDASLSRAAEHKSRIKKMLYRTLSVASSVTKTVLPDTKKKDDIQDTKFDYEFCICKTASEFIAQYPKHKTENSIEIAKNETTLNWIFFSPAIQNLLHRKVIQLFSKDREYLGYCICDIKEVRNSKYMHISEMKFLKPDKNNVHALISYVKLVAKNEGCFQLTYRQLIPDDTLNSLLRKEFLRCRLTDGNYHIKFKKNFISDVDPYSIYAPSDIDPDLGFI